MSNQISITPPNSFSFLLAIRNAFVAIRTNHPAPFSVTSSLNMLTAMNVVRKWPWIWHSSAASERSTSVSPVSVTINSGSGLFKSWITRLNPQSYSTNSRRESRLRERKAMATSYTASRRNCLFGNHFYWLYQKGWRTEKVSIQIIERSLPTWRRKKHQLKCLVPVTKTIPWLRSFCMHAFYTHSHNNALRPKSSMFCSHVWSRLPNNCA